MHNDSESDGDTPAPRFVPTKTAQTALCDVINFFEGNPAYADKHLTQLWAVMDDIKKLSKHSAKQSTMLDCFKI